jgi:hypothetical protein
MAVVLEAVRELLIHVLPENGEVKSWLEHQPWYSPWILSLALAGLLAAIIAVEFRRHQRAKAPDRISPDLSGPLSPTLRLQLLDNIREMRVDPRLRQGLRKALRVDLGLTEIPGSVQPKLREYAIAEGGTLTNRPITGTIQDVFEKTAGGQLLILGEPGTGKTNLLLELANTLIEEAKSNQTFPIPVVFNLPRWTLGKEGRTLGEWLQDDLGEYGLSRETAGLLLQKTRILPLLDGLDEVSESRRVACVKAITEFQKGQDLCRLVVCCRTTEYASLPKLELRSAVRIEKLARADVEREVARPRLERVRRALKSDPELWQVIDTPLWLHVLYAASQVDPAERDAKVDPRDWLYARYVKYALDREMEDSPRRRTTDELLLRWLGWLAAEMQHRAQTQFALEDLNETWIRSEPVSRAVRQFHVGFAGLVFGLIDGLIVGLVFGLIDGLIVGLFFSLIGGYVTAMYPEREVEELRFSWYGFGTGLVGGLSVELIEGLLVGLVFGLGVGLVLWLVVGRLVELVAGLVGGLGVGLFIGLFVGLQPQSVSQRSAPNRGTLRSLRYALEFALSSAALALTFLFLARRLWPHTFPSVVSCLLVFMIWLGFMSAFDRGGYFVLLHYITRLFLKLIRVAPLRYVRFLNEATERLFLIRHGGSYEFLHVTFRDYMARFRGSNANIHPLASSKERS